MLIRRRFTNDPAVRHFRQTCPYTHHAICILSIATFSLKPQYIYRA